MNHAINEEINNLIEELKKMCTDCTEHPESENRTVFLGNNISRVKQIGNRLHLLGGYSLLLSVYNEIPRHDQLELQYAWDGVGEWEV
jgi:hypothetical protein